MTASSRASAAGEFDYLVIGAGSAGCAVAGRLAETPTTSVAVIESGGPDDHYLIWTPVGLAKTVVKPGPYNYGYNSEPQAALGGRTNYQPRRRVLGGSSSLNGMVYIRGHQRDYDDWAALGCHGWSFEDVLPYFLRSENNPRFAGTGNPWHGTDGPLYVNDLRSPNPFAQSFLKAATQAGHKLNDDFNGADQEGFGYYQVTQHNGERWNAARAYLHRGKTTDGRYNGGRPNLHVMTGAQALRIVFEGRRAVGVVVARDGVEQVLRARREVIVSGGVFNSPQLLLASGIGPAGQLRALGIDVRQDLPGVGENLQDHLDIVINTQLDSTDLFGATLRGGLRLFKEMRRYRRDRTGMLSSNFVEAGAFVKSRPELERPDLNLVFTVALIGNRNMGSRRKLGHGYSGHICVLRPESRGSVRLHSPDMRDAPRIDTQLMTAPRDMETLIAGIHIMRDVFNQPALRSLGGREMKSESFADEASLREFVRAHADCLYHPVGTCKMGAANDRLAVVDPTLRVHGFDGLRVVDCSIMPTLIGGNTNAPAMMIGEKAADMIRAAAH
ncbi:choline dehydrogenase-like flavoprotein [Paraburkholderia eburnea]|uniref:Choline dehydrogenase-like flavoprotein n=1 Tax=Paraburkholderia eburnea TaxID=1189126 RepID=A0A2S4LZS9_9BURK|nr:GMC family oxidoreductase N-terminal domain-containing protein [Paraburkholderia eburnea]POR47976.1 choline dehydrogenase-like flavoprotein [Paraburkholderia eburnea]PRZ19370.1 choline dehydrogenase-like flavoprotein [Paraburkholderia eburnea]